MSSMNVARSPMSLNLLPTVLARKIYDYGSNLRLQEINRTYYNVGLSYFQDYFTSFYALCQREEIHYESFLNHARIKKDQLKTSFVTHIFIEHLREVLRESFHGHEKLDLMKHSKLKMISPYQCVEIIKAIEEQCIRVKNLLEPRSRAELNRIETLSYSKLFLTRIPDSTFSRKRMRVLDLSNNFLEDIHPGIGELVHLRELNLRNNRIKRLTQIEILSRLFKLHLDSNDMTYLPIEIGQLVHLNHLSVTNNYLETIPKEIGKLTLLKFLDLGSNCLTSVPSTIEQLTGLKELILNDNQITTFPISMKGLHEITFLDLSHNRLREVPEGICTCTTVHLSSNSKIDLRYNRIERELKEVDHRVKVKILPNHPDWLAYRSPWIEEAKILQAIVALSYHIFGKKICDNRLEINSLLDKPDSHVARQYRRQLIEDMLDPVHLVNRMIDTVIQSGREFDKQEMEIEILKIRECSVNHLTTLITTRALVIREIDLSRSKLSLIPSQLFECLGLNKLKLAFNRIQDIPLEISKLKKLTVLDLSHNLLDTFPFGIRNLKQLRSINLSYNRISLAPVSDRLKIWPNLQVFNIEGQSTIQNLASLPDRCVTIIHEFSSDRIGEVNRRFHRIASSVAYSYFKLFFALCDRRDFSYEAILSEARIRRTQVKTASLARNLICHLGDLVRELSRGVATLNEMEYSKLKVTSPYQCVEMMEVIQQLRAYQELVHIIPGIYESEHTYLEQVESNKQLAKSFQRLGDRHPLLKGKEMRPTRIWLPERTAALLEKMKSLPVSMLNAITTIKYEHLSCQIPDVLSYLPALTCLNLSNNYLEAVSSKIGLLVHLRQLRLCHNHLREISPEIGRLQNLEELSLKGNYITNLPSTIGELKRLHYLNVNNNFIRTIPKTVSQLEKLTYLDFGYNHLKDIPSELRHLTNLIELILDDNQITAFDPIQLPPNLASLHLSDNHLEEIPRGMQRLHKLVELYLVMNHIRHISIESFKGMRELQTVNLQDNPLKSTSEKLDDSIKIGLSLRDEVRDQKRIRGVCFLGHYVFGKKAFQNAIKTFVDIRQAQFREFTPSYVDYSAIFNKTLSSVQLGIRELDLSGLKLDLIPSELFLLRNLQKVQLSWNHVKDVPIEVQELAHLTELDLSHNRLWAFPYTVLKAKKLRILNLDYNRIWTDIPDIRRSCPEFTALHIVGNVDVTPLTVEI